MVGSGLDEDQRQLEGVTHREKKAGATARLKPEYFDLYADYFIKFLQAYRKEGIEIHSLTLQNEPQNDLSGYPCMRMDAAEQIRLVTSLAPKMKARGFKTQIFVHDHNWTLHKNDRVALGGDQKTEPLESVSKMLSDPEVSQWIAGSAWHCYAGGARKMEEVYHDLGKRFPNRMILTTEISAWGLDRGPWWGDVEWGMAHVWLRPQLHGSAAAIQWNLALDHQAGPTLRDDSEAIGLVTINTEKNNAVSYEREFYAMAHLSRAAQPGAKRISANGSGDRSGGLDVIAFDTPEGEISLVIFNRNGDGRSFQVKENERGFSYDIPGHSIATFTW